MTDPTAAPDRTQAAIDAIDETVALFRSQHAELMALVRDAPLSKKELKRFMRAADPGVVRDFERTAERVKAVIRADGPPGEQKGIARVLYERAATTMVWLLKTQQEMIELLRRAPVTTD
jgi:hypothetical protein